MNTLNIVISSMWLAVSILGLFQIRTSRTLEKRTHDYFLAFFCILTACTLANLIEQISAEYTGESFIWVNKLSLFLESGFSSALPVFLTGYLVYSAGRDRWKDSSEFIASVTLWIIYIALLIYTQFSTTIYYYDAGGEYHRGPFYPLLLVPVVLIMAVNLVALLRGWGKLTQRIRAAVAIVTIIPMLSVLLQMRIYGFYIIVIGISVSAYILLHFILLEQTEHYFRQEQENARLRNELMLSQIQPHFLLNALGVVRDLCDTPEAKAAVGRFATYLRGNMSALTESGMIPFSSELEHTKAYLDLEQLRFESALRVEYDITCSDFALPTLTLQPIVENAVRHGARGVERDVSTVSIATREREDHYEIIVSDDGPGFDPDHPRLRNDGRAHIGIPNVRERLREICGGELRIESELGSGTKATIILPKESVKKC